MTFWVYMLQCAGRTYYVGQTDDLARRVAQHEDGTFGGWTSTRRPVMLVWSREFPRRDEAVAAELQIKGWSRAKKEALIAADWELVGRIGLRRTPPGGR